MRCYIIQHFKLPPLVLNIERFKTYSILRNVPKTKVDPLLFITIKSAMIIKNNPLHFEFTTTV
jgi:hypothetical protein